MDKQTDTHTKKNLKTNTDANAGPPDTGYLYYPLDTEGVTEDKKSNNNNNKKNFHQ